MNPNPNSSHTPTIRSDGVEAIRSRLVDFSLNTFPIPNPPNQTIRPDGVDKEYAPNGFLIYEGGIQNGKRHGHGKQYSVDNGRLMYEGDFADGKRQGYGTMYYGSSYYEKGTFENGMRHGHIQRFTMQGVMALDAFYQMDVLYGSATYYYEDGVKSMECTYEGGLLNGRVKEYTKTGQLVFDGIYKDGHPYGYCKEWYPRGSLKFDGQYMSGYQRAFGKFYFYPRDGMGQKGYIEFEENWEDGVLHYCE